MEHLPLFVLDPAEPAVLPGERRRLLLSTERMRTAVRLALRDGGRLALLAFDPAQMREGEEPEVEPDRLLGVATACVLLHGDVQAEGGFAVVRGTHRVEIVATHSGGCCAHDDPYTEGTEAHCEPFPAAVGSAGEAGWDGLAALLGRLELLPAAVRGPDLEARIDRLGRSLNLVPWVQAEFLAARDLGTRMGLLTAAARELSSPGASFRPDDLDAPYGSAEEYFDDLVRAWDCRARAQSPAGSIDDERHVALVREAQLRRRRRAAALRARAGNARIARRLAASAQADALPALERVRAAHELDAGEIHALLAAGLGSHERFRDRVQQAARLLPPGEMPLGAWIDALEAGAFPAV
jgi:hypothetical protein